MKAVNLSDECSAKAGSMNSARHTSEGVGNGAECSCQMGTKNSGWF